MVLGIVSIVTCSVYGIPGLICGIICLSQYKVAKREYDTNPMIYEKSYKMVRAGYICGVIGTILSALYFVAILGLLIFAAIEG